MPRRKLELYFGAAVLAQACMEFSGAGYWVTMDGPHLPGWSESEHEGESESESSSSLSRAIR